MSFDDRKLYDDLVDEIFKNDKPVYDSLVVFIYNLLERHVQFWCGDDSFLQGGMHHEDVMQEIQIRIIQKCERYFFKPQNEQTDKSCEEFKAWCYKVAKNYFITYCVNQKYRKAFELKMSACVNNELFESVTPEDGMIQNEKFKDEQVDLNRCFAVVMNLNSSPHIILTWLSVSCFMLESDMSKIDSTHSVIKKFSESSLLEMFDSIIFSIEKLGLLSLPDELILRQKKKLFKVHPGTGKIIGDMRYEDFYMNKGPEMSVSDWINRINSQIKKQMSIK